MCRFYSKYLLIVLLIITAGCDNEDDVTPGFLTPPDEYYLVEETIVIEDGVATSADLNFIRYNDNGKFTGDGIFYDNQGRLIQSPWPNRTALNGLYYYDGNVADSIVTVGHPRYTLYFDLEYSQEKPSRIRIYRRENDRFELNLVEDLLITYPSEDEILIRTDDRTLQYKLDNGRSPYPYEYRLSQWWWPYSQNITQILTDRNVLERTVSIDGEEPTVTTYTYEYNEFGYPTRQTLGNRSVYFKYSETLN